MSTKYIEKHVELCDFLFELIDVQIKKYVKLATVGIGPDARLNSALVFKEVNELLELEGFLLEEMRSNKGSGEIKSSVFNKVFFQVKFYVEQESLRAYAGWLLDENNIHTTVDNRTKQQSSQLESLA